MDRSRLIRAICTVFEITRGEFYSRYRRRDLVDARAAYIKLTRPDSTLHRVGDDLGLDHSTINHHFSRDLKFDPDFALAIERVKTEYSRQRTVPTKPSRRIEINKAKRYVSTHRM